MVTWVIVILSLLEVPPNFPGRLAHVVCLRPDRRLVSRLSPLRGHCQTPVNASCCVKIPVLDDLCIKYLRNGCLKLGSAQTLLVIYQRLALQPKSSVKFHINTVNLLQFHKSDAILNPDTYPSPNPSFNQNSNPKPNPNPRKLIRAVIQNLNPKGKATHDPILKSNRNPNAFYFTMQDLLHCKLLLI